MTEPANILVVDDNPIVRLGLEHALTSAGHHVTEAGTGQECLRLLSESAPDLVLLDVMLPDVYGVELCRQVKLLPGMGQTFVVLLSSTEVSTDRQATGLEAGADGYIARPIENRELLARIESLLRIQRAESALRAAHGELERRVEQRTSDLSRANKALQSEVLVRHEAEQAQRRLAERLKVLHAIDQTILAAQSPEAVAQAALEGIKPLLPYEQASVWEIDEVAGTVSLLLKCDEQGMGTGGRTRFSFEQIRLSRAYQSGQPCLLKSAPNLFDPEGGVREWNALMDLPLKADQHLVGVLNFASDGIAGFTAEHQEIAVETAAQLAVALRQARLFEQLVAGREQLRALSLRLVEVQEQERRSVARELHDEIGQLLTGLKLQLDVCAPQAADAVRQKLDEALILVNDLMARVRKLSLDLRPPILDDLGLLEALNWHFQRYTRQTNIRVQFKHGLPEERIAGHLETAVFRIVQEALTNVARHAAVQEVQVRVWANAERVGLQIEDHGAGFDTELARRGSSSGLTGMRERAVLLGGEFTLESTFGRGTCITVELPREALPASQEQTRPAPHG